MLIGVLGGICGLILITSIGLLWYWFRNVRKRNRRFDDSSSTSSSSDGDQSFAIPRPGYRHWYQDYLQPAYGVPVSLIPQQNMYYMSQPIEKAPRIVSKC